MNDKPDKPWYTSKTLWFNALTIIASAAIIVKQELASLPVDTTMASLGLFGAINFILRCITKAGLTK